MRLDKYLKVSRIIKRRTIAKEACDGGRVTLNGRVAKAGSEVNENDVMEIRFGNRVGRYQITDVREVVRKENAAEMYRVLAPGGVLCVVELSTPTNKFIKFFYDLYTRHIIPFVGRSKSKDARAYSYLPESIAAVPQGEAMLQIMRRIGFKQCQAIAMTFGTCSIYVGVK